MPVAAEHVILVTIDGTAWDQYTVVVYQHMKVKELRDSISYLPDDAEVMIHFYEDRNGIPPLVRDSELFTMSWDIKHKELWLHNLPKPRRLSKRDWKRMIPLKEDD